MSEIDSQTPEFIERLKDAFDEMVVYKDLKKSNFISSFKLPSFMRDWVLKHFQDDNGEINVDGAVDFIRELERYCKSSSKSRTDCSIFSKSCGQY